MANIWEGSFVLGEVSATTLSAGPGIKITTDEPGVIKVSNDETVLYSGAGTSAVPLSETLLNFERVRIEGYGNEDVGSANKGIFEFPNSNPNYDLHYVRYNQGQYKVEYLSRYSETNKVLNLGWHNHYYGTAGSTTYAGVGSCAILITKVVGINRTNGGN